MTHRLAVFASGSGSNLQALIDRFTPGSDAEVILVVSDRAGSGALERARAAGIDAAHIPVGSSRNEADVARETLNVLEQHRIDVVALAGYLRLIPAAVVAAYRHRLVNIHPALLPAFGGPGMYGRRVHEAVLAAGCRVTGVTVHHVDDRYDEGSIIAQWPVPVLPGDTSATLAERVLRVEHRLYPAALAVLVRRMAAGDTTSGVTQPDGDTFRLAPSLEGIENEISALVNP